MSRYSYSANVEPFRELIQIPLALINSPGVQYQGTEFPDGSSPSESIAMLSVDIGTSGVVSPATSYRHGISGLIDILIYKCSE